MSVLAAVLLLTWLSLPPDQGRMWSVVRGWGRLARIPGSARDVQIGTEGGMFTRAFRASFSAPVGEVNRWLAESPGTSEAVPERTGPTSRQFLIRPGGGAAHAEVSVDDHLGMVGIYVYWS